ncbi:ATP-binding protein [Pseudoalteromonas sp. PB2-1]|uniref:ATP-binding protein n=1 Tax=Pseudoalteromonas sp. PB2-1 TaxID=2907242 RepID=UPI00386AAEC1|tara:strand:+ start:1276 stop:2523 length:1248 start_codon:yes stop_codon:yes gene_type:complete
MGKLFASLYLYIIVSLFLVSGVIEQLWPYEDSQQQIALDKEFGKSLWLLSQTKDGLSKLQDEFDSEIIDRNDLALPDDLKADLASHHYLYLFNQQQEVIWYITLNDQQLLHIGPLTVSNPSFSSVWPYFLLLMVVGVPVGLWSFLLWRDFNKLTLACEAVGGAQDFELHDASKSFFLPITDTLSAMQERIQYLLAAQQELTSSVSHEFRTPLARLKFAIAMLEEQVENEQSFTYLDNMHADIVELEALVSEMLEYARLESHKPNLINRSCDLTMLVSSVVNKLEFATDIDVQIKAPLSLIYKCDEHFMARCIQNLLGNAQKYAAHTIIVSLEEHNKELVMTVEDDGPGIAKSEWESVFKPFTRLDKSRDKKTGGFGLGLAIVAKIISWHRGTYEVSDSELGGAKFTIRLFNTEDY